MNLLGISGIPKQMVEDKKDAAPLKTASEKDDNKGDSGIDSTEDMMPNSTGFTFMSDVYLSKLALGLTSGLGLVGFCLLRNSRPGSPPASTG